MRLYLNNQQNVDLDQRKQDLKASFNNPELSSDLVLKLEELRDLELGISWEQYKKAEGNYDLIRGLSKNGKDMRR